MASTPIIKSLVLRSSLNLKAISESSKSFAAGIGKATISTKNIADSIQKGNLTKQKLISNDESFFRKRRQSVKRKEKEGLIEASGLQGAVKRQGRVVSDSTKGFLGRVMDFVGTLMVGWLASNLPTIIKGAQELMEQIQGVVNITSGWINTVVGILTELDFELQNEDSKLSEIRVQESSQEVQKELQVVETAVGGFENQAIDGLNEYNEAVDEENKRRRGESDPEEAPNQWWDPLKIIPNKKKEKEEDVDDVVETASNLEKTLFDSKTKEKSEKKQQETKEPQGQKNNTSNDDLFADEPDYDNDREAWNQWNKKESDALKQNPESSGFDMFEDGGIIQGKSHKEGGENINVEGGEAVIPKKSVDSYGPEFINRIIQNKEQDNVTKLRAARSLMEKLVDKHKEDNMGIITTDEFDKIKGQTMDKLKQSLSGFTKEITQTVSAKANKELVKAIEPTQKVLESAKLSSPRKGSVIYMLNNQGGSSSQSSPAPTRSKKKSGLVVGNSKGDFYKKIASTLYAYT
tara:strand:- start:966 stop:2522 length:1557 start_codon:yes stop_codon:yes gene_type:complete